MKILWLVSMTLPAAAKACGLASASDVSGGWLEGQLAALRGQAELVVCCADPRMQKVGMGTLNGVRYCLLPDAQEETFRILLAAEKPDVVHIWGTEYEGARRILAAAGAAHTLVGIQGVMRDCARHLCDGVPARYLRSCALQRAIDRRIPGGLLDVQQTRFDALAQGEAALLADARFVTGRTEYDRAAAAKLAPHARYFLCNETLRPVFSVPDTDGWRMHSFGSAPVLLLSQGNYPLKNLHTVLQAMPALLHRWPGLQLTIAGWPPLEKNWLLNPLIHWMFPYQNYCRRLIRHLELEEHVRYTGPLDAAAMKEAYLGADLFLLPSFCENSPNSLGEAMLLGLPCVASAVGGIPSMAQDGKEALLYSPAGDAAALAERVAALLTQPETAQKLGRAARRRALKTHNAATNAKALLTIYKTVAEGGRSDG
jgi:glycosyltransferase involved in cell wall biosynthesis